MGGGKKPRLNSFDSSAGSPGPGAPDETIKMNLLAVSDKLRMMTPASLFNVEVKGKSDTLYLTEPEPATKTNEKFLTEIQNLKNFCKKENTSYLNNCAEDHHNLAYGKLKLFLFKIKETELTFRSSSKIFKKYVEQLFKKFDQIKEDPRTLKADLVFNSLLSFEFENSQKILVTSVLDLLNQIRWVNDYEDIVNEQVSEDKVMDKQFFYKLRNILVDLLFPKMKSFEYYHDIFTAGHGKPKKYFMKTSDEYYPFNQQKKSMKHYKEKIQEDCKALGQNPV